MTDLNIAETIYNQLGAGRFLTMTGAKSLVAIDDGLQFKIPQAKQGINGVRIELNSHDQYDITYHKIRETKFEIQITEQNKQVDIPAENLAQAFENATGLYLTF